MPRLKNKLPAYCKHGTGQAYVTLNSREFYLGKHGTAASRTEYERVLAEWLAGGRTLREGHDLTVNELLDAFRGHVETYYVKDGRPTSEQSNFRLAMRHVRELYGDQLVTQFGPLALKSIRQRIISANNARKYINDQVARIKLIFKWGVAEELVPSHVFEALRTVASLRKGRSQARETKPVRPVDDEHVDAVEPFVSRQIWAMVQLQRLTGMRSGEVVIMRGCDLDVSCDVWRNVPSSHKTQHHAKDRVVDLGPRAQTVLRPFLKGDPTEYLFSPREAERERHERAGTHRHSDQKPSARKTRRTVGNRYTTASYRRAITRACKLADLAARESLGVPNLTTPNSSVSC